MKKTAFASGILLMLLGIALALATLFFLPHCGGEKIMRCIWMTRSVAAVGFGIAVLGCAMQFASRGAAIGLEAGVLVLSLLVIALSTVVIGSCPNPMMKCHTITEPVLIIWGAVLALVSLADMWRLSRLRG